MSSVVGPALWRQQEFFLDHDVCVCGDVPAHGDVEGDVQVWLVAAGVELHIPLGRHTQDVPLH